MDNQSSAPDDGADTPPAGEDDTVNEKVAITRGRRDLPPIPPPEAINPYVAPRVKRRRGSEWPVLLFALVASGLIMAICCIAGFALYVRNGGAFN